MSRQLLTPSPSPPPAVPTTPTISAQINAATRKQHVVLNRLIIDRLPLALPPNQQTPALYCHGLAAFSQVYFTFESAWSEFAKSPKYSSHLNSTEDVQLRRWLTRLRPEGLERSARLKDDLSHISSCTGVSATPPSAPQSRRLRAMRSEIMARPHVLAAYSWVMYMAIFSGGRWIRQELAKAGDAFWIQQIQDVDIDEDEKTPIGMLGFSFLSFNGQQDGEDIKTLFKARLAEAEKFLTQQQRQDIIDASQQLFEDCIAMVGELDRLAWRQFMLNKARLALTCLLVSVGLCYLYWTVTRGR